jgi:two-component system sensor histidine kinase/response regulator
LVVDDNAQAREILTDAVRGFSLRAGAATSGDEALRELAAADSLDPYSLVLMDWHMPGMDGLEASRIIKKEGRLKNIPRIVMVTAFGREDVRGKAEEIGIEGYLLKPVSSSLLYDTFMNLFGTADDLGAVRAAKETSAAYNANGLRILLVEDNEMNQQVATELLESAGAVVTIANHGGEAVKRLKEGPEVPEFEVVLMDLQMPEMDGYQATARIRAEPRLADLPIVAMTAHAMAEERDRCLAAGMRGHITKPIDPELLYRTLMQFHRPGQVTTMAGKPVDRFSHAAALPEIAGLDVADGLSRVAGNMKLYRSLLGQFVEQQADAVSAVRAGLECQDFGLAERVMHTLKGVSGNLGAKALSGLTAELEKSLRDHDTQSLEAGLPGLADELARVIEAIRDSLAAGGAEASPRTPISDSTEAVRLLKQLKQMLADDDGAALDYLLDARERVEGVISDADLNALQKAVRDFDFTAALDCLSGIAQRHKFALE